MKRKLHPLLDRLGIPRCGLHAFRHANGTLMDRLGSPMKVRQQRLGHADPRMTLGVYTHMSGEDDRRLAAQLGELLTVSEGEILHPIAPKLEKEVVADDSQTLVVQ